MGRRVCFLVDGFNLYHSLREVEKQRRCQCHWLDLSALCGSYLPLIGGGATLGAVYYFSAKAYHAESWRRGTVARHEAFIEALESTGVVVELGKFKPKDVHDTCPHCHRRIHLKRHEEKETDVRIAAKLLEVVADRSCDAACVITGDTDIVPAVAAARRLQPHVDVHMLFPPFRSNLAFTGVATHTFKIKPKQYQKYQLPDPVTTPGGRVIHKPASW